MNFGHSAFVLLCLSICLSLCFWVYVSSHLLSISDPFRRKALFLVGLDWDRCCTVWLRSVASISCWVRSKASCVFLWYEFQLNWKQCRLFCFLIDFASCVSCMFWILYLMLFLLLFCRWSYTLLSSGFIIDLWLRCCHPGLWTRMTIRLRELAQFYFWGNQ